MDLRGKDQTSNNEILPRRCAEQMRREDQQRVKPPPGLIDTLRDEIGRECTLKQFLVLERIMKLSVGHTKHANA
jgi:hypothetical protein